MRGIRVMGTGLVQRVPDIATVVLGVAPTAVTAGEAQRLASQRMRAVMEALAGLGIEPRDVATRRIGLDQTWDHRAAQPRPTGYQAHQELAVRVRDLSMLGRAVDAAIEAGADQVADVSLTIADAAEAHVEARDLAMQDARQRAEQLARAGGVRLGLPLAIDESGRPDGPGPMARAKVAMSMAADMPVATGEQAVEVTLVVTWAIVGVQDPRSGG